MVKPMKYTRLAKLLRQAGYLRTEGRGDHEKWTHGRETVIITQTGEVSPGIVRKALQSIARSKEDK